MKERETFRKVQKGGIYWVHGTPKDLILSPIIGIFLPILHCSALSFITSTNLCMSPTVVIFLPVYSMASLECTNYITPTGPHCLTQ